MAGGDKATLAEDLEHVFKSEQAKSFPDGVHYDWANIASRLRLLGWEKR